MAETIVKDGFLGSTSRRRARGRGTPASPRAAATDSALARPLARFDAASSLRSGRPAVTWHRVAPDHVDEPGTARHTELGGDRPIETPPPDRTPARRAQRHVPGWLVAILALAAGMAMGIVLHGAPEPAPVDDSARLQACARALDVASERALLEVTRGSGETQMLVAVNENDMERVRAELDRLAVLREHDVEKGEQFNELRSRCER